LYIDEQINLQTRAIQMPSNPETVIIGAGIGGLTAALALARRGRPVTVLEQAAELREVGAGLQLSANATRVLFELGLESELRQTANFPAGKSIRLWNTGQTWKLFDLGAESVERFGFPYLTLYRPDLLAALANALQRADPRALQLGARCVGVEQSADKAVALLDDGRRIEADILIGADGVHSMVRSALFGADAPRFSGCMAWRGVIPAADLPPHLRAPVGVNWIGPGGHVVHYPLRAGKLVNFVGILERDGWIRESWNERGSIDESLRDFAGWHDDIHTMIRAIEVPYKWALMLRDPIPNWTVGRISLMGDACHATLPFLAQGAAMAIEDGYLLARAIDEIDGTPNDVLQRYQQARIERTSKIVRGSAANAERFHNPALGHAEGAAAYVDAEWQPDRVRERYDWLFRYDVNAVAL
jgi:salicylate hydroxylase